MTRTLVPAILVGLLLAVVGLALPQASSAMSGLLPAAWAIAGPWRVDR